MAHLTSTTLIESVKRRASIPDSQLLLTDDDILAFANEELLMSMLPVVMSMNEEFYVYSEDVDLVNNTSNYSIPYRAIGGKLRDLFFRDTNGNLSELTRISPDDRGYFQNSNVSGSFRAFYVQGDEIILVPDIGSAATGSLVFSYYLRPNKLVDTDRVATISSIAVGASTTVYTVDAVPTGMIASVQVDLMQTKPGHKIKTFDITPTATSSTTLTFNNSDLPANVVVGDYISFSGECIIPQLPPELHSVLSEKVAARVMEALGDTAGLQAANAKIAEMEAKTSVLIDNRVEGAPQKIVNKFGFLRQGIRSYRRRF